MKFIIRTTPTGRSNSFDQRLSASHPDPDGKQLAVLREAFERIITKQLQVTWMPIGVQWELRSGSQHWCRCIVNDYWWVIVVYDTYPAFMYVDESMFVKFCSFNFAFMPLGSTCCRLLWVKLLHFWYLTVGPKQSKTVDSSSKGWSWCFSGCSHPLWVEIWS